MTVSTTGPGGTYTFADNQPILLFPEAVAAGWTVSGDTATGPVNSVTSISLDSPSIDNATNDTFTIRSVAAPTTIYPGSGDDVFNVTANGIPAADSVTISDSRTAGSDQFNIDTGGTLGTLQTGQLGRERYQAVGMGLIDITSTKPSIGDSFSNLTSGALTLDLNSLYATPTVLTTTISVSSGQMEANVSGAFARFFSIGVLAAVDVSGTSAGEDLTLDYTHGDPLPASGLTYDPVPAVSSASNTLTLQSGTGGTTFTSDTYAPSGAGAGRITYSDASNSNVPITFSNLTPVTDTVPSTNLLFTVPTAATQVAFNAGPVVGGTATTAISDNGTGTFETLNFANKTAVTADINNAGATTRVFANPAAGLTDLSVNSEAGNDSVYLSSTPAGTTTQVDLGSGGHSIAYLGAPALLLSNFLGDVDVQSPGGSNGVEFDDRSVTGRVTYTISGATLTATSMPATVSFGAGISGLLLGTADVGGATVDLTGPAQGSIGLYQFIASGTTPNTLNITSNVPTLNSSTSGMLTFGAGQPTVDYTDFQTINVTKPASPPVGTGVTINGTEGQR